MRLITTYNFSVLRDGSNYYWYSHFLTDMTVVEFIVATNTYLDGLYGAGSLFPSPRKYAIFNVAEVGELSAEQIRAMASDFTDSHVFFRGDKQPQNLNNY